MECIKRDDKASFLKQALSERGSVQALSPRQKASHFGAARDERDGPSPLQDVMRCPTQEAGQIRVVPRNFSPLTAVRGVFFVKPGTQAAIRSAAVYAPIAL